MSRISIDSNVSAYRSDYADYVVLLDGNRVPFAISADTESGEVLCNAIDDAGNLVSEGDEWVTIIRRGHVEIVRVDDYECPLSDI